MRSRPSRSFRRITGFLKCQKLAATSRGRRVQREPLGFASSTWTIAQHPQLGGIAWHYIHYILGLIRLRHDVFYFEDSGEWPYALTGGPRRVDWVAPDARQNVSHLDRVMRRFGLDSRWAYRNAAAREWHGMSDQRRNSIIDTADVIINVSGSVDRPEAYRKRALLVYIDTDPVFTQTKIALGTETSQGVGTQRTLNADYFKRWRERLLAKRVALHDVHFSFGETLSSKVPPTHFFWRPTRQPIVLDEWASHVSPRPPFTTVMSWTSYPPLAWKGQIYGQKDVEFERFRSLPGRVPGSRSSWLSVRCCTPTGKEGMARFCRRRSSLPGGASQTRLRCARI